MQVTQVGVMNAAEQFVCVCVFVCGHLRVMCCHRSFFGVVSAGRDLTIGLHVRANLVSLADCDCIVDFVTSPTYDVSAWKERWHRDGMWRGMREKGKERGGWQWEETREKKKRY